jgi:hypothetical protein
LFELETRLINSDKAGEKQILSTSSMKSEVLREEGALLKIHSRQLI